MLFSTAHNTSNRQRVKVLITAFMLLIGLSAATRGLAQNTTTAGAETPYATLADMLENTQTRDKLIEQLRTLAKQAGPLANAKTPPDKSAPGTPDHQTNTVQRLATTLQNTTQGLNRDLSSAAAAIKSLVQGELPASEGPRTHGAALSTLLFAVLATLVSYFVLRLLAGLAFARLNSWIRSDHADGDAPKGVAQGANTLDPTRGPRSPLGLSRKLLGVSAALVVDLAATVLASLAGYAAALITSHPGQDSTGFAFQFLTAFVMIEAVKALSRGIFATRYEHLRLLPLDPQTARYWNRWLTLMIGLTGYCLLVIVPITQAVLLQPFSRLLGLLIMVGVYIYGMRIVWSQRKAVKTGLADWAKQSDAPILGTLARVLSRLWHLIATAYLTILLVASQADQQLALTFMTRATAQSVIAIILGALAASVLSSLLARHISIPSSWNKALPLLEPRLNAYVPAAIKGLRLVILILVTLVVLDAWHAFDLGAWLQSTGGREFIAVLLRVGVIVAIAVLGWTVIASLIENRLGTNNQPSEREKTLLMLFRNAAVVVIATMTILVVLSQIGINIGPLIAGAGVAGLAIGFGAQKLVQDVITGIFIQLENGMNQNDTVEVCGLFGTVEKITIRSVVIRTLDGGYHLIPFSSIDKVSNHTRGYGYHYAEYNIAHRENVDEAMAQMKLAFKDLMQDPELAPEVLDEISIPGVTALNERGFSIRVLIKTTPGNQWAVQRGYNKLLKQRFDAAGIELPYPHSVVHFDHDKTGHAPPVDIHIDDATPQPPATGSTAS